MQQQQGWWGKGQSAPPTANVSMCVASAVPQISCTLHTAPIKATHSHVFTLLLSLFLFPHTLCHRTAPQGTIKAAKQALSQVDAARVRAVGVSGQQHGMVVLDKQDRVLRPAKVSQLPCAMRFCSSACCLET
jgi:hypothetical protein